MIPRFALATFWLLVVVPSGVSFGTDMTFGNNNRKVEPRFAESIELGWSL